MHAVDDANRLPASKLLQSRYRGFRFCSMKYESVREQVNLASNDSDCAILAVAAHHTQLAHWSDTIQFIGPTSDT